MTTQRPNISDMVNAYTEAIYFTETGDGDQPSRGATLSDYDKAVVWNSCRNFIEAIHGLTIPDRVTCEQVGHDLWLTRNHHGTGFWDRPGIYGEELSDTFTRLAHAMGEHDVTFSEGELT